MIETYTSIIKDKINPELKRPKAKHVFYLDALRAAAILAVIIFHIAGGVLIPICPNLPGTLNLEYIYHTFFATCFKFGVPIFLMLTGALTLGKNRDFITLLKQRIPRIAIPFIFWSVVTFIIMIIIFHYAPFTNYDNLPYDGIKNIGYYFYEFLLGKTRYSAPLWYFWLILVIYLISPILNKWIVNSSMKEVEYILCIWFIYCISKYYLSDVINLPIMFSGFIELLGYVILGYYLRYCERDIFNNKLYAVIIIILSVIFLMIFALFTTGKQSFLELGSIFIILETAGIFILFKNFKTETPFTIFKTACSSLAKHSYGIYLIHFPVLIYCVDFLPLNFSLATKGFVLFVLVTGLSWLIMAICERLPYLDRVIGSK